MAYEQFRADAKLATGSLDPALQAAIANGTFSEDSVRYALSPGLMGFLYPHQDRSTATPPADELANVAGLDVTLVAGGASSQIGRATKKLVINSPQNYAALPLEQKQALSQASAGDVIGVSYELYEYLGAGGSVNLADPAQYANASRWRKLGTDFITGSEKAGTQTVSLRPGKTVRVQYDSWTYGLYRYLGPAGSSNLVRENFLDASRWRPITRRRGT